jgi:hypothetical protein
MNPFEEHAVNMAEYVASLNEAGGPAPASPTSSIVLKVGGKPTIFEAVCGPFEVRQLLTLGGLTPVSQSEVIVQKVVLPAGTVFKSGTDVTVNMIGGSVYLCRVQMAKDVYTEWHLTVQDKHFKA